MERSNQKTKVKRVWKLRCQTSYEAFAGFLSFIIIFLMSILVVFVYFESYVIPHSLCSSSGVSLMYTDFGNKVD